MTEDEARAILCAACGIVPAYVDQTGTLRETSPDTARALLAGNGVDVSGPAALIEQARAVDAAERVLPRDILCRSGGPVAVDLPDAAAWSVAFEEGGGREGQGALSLSRVPMGVHAVTLRHRGRTEETALIAAPRRAPSVRRMAGRDKVWGATAALYGLSDTEEVGTYRDLASAAEALGRHGAAFLGLNPVHAMGWADRVTTSPYSPSHRAFLSAWHIAPETPGPAPARGDLIDYPAHYARQADRLRADWDAFCRSAEDAARDDLHAFTARRGAALQRFARFEALSARHGDDWRTWPARAADAADPDLAREARFHAWLQWRADRQLAAAQARAHDAGMALGLYLDLAVGARRGGAEAWAERDAVAGGVSMGAPPDGLNPTGQNWQVTAFAPAKLRAARYRAFREMLAATMRHAGVLRIDHVLGLDRAFWVPDDGSPGGYVEQPFDALLAIVAIEATRAGCVVIGEDLGLVPDGFRHRIQARGLLSYTVYQFERTGRGFRSPSRLPRQSLACFGTHDLPTLAGYRAGRDIDWWHRLGWIDAAEAARMRKERRADIAKLGTAVGAGGPPDAIRLHAALARSPAALVSVQLDDLTGTVEPQNLPGTVAEHPNWRRRAPVAPSRLADLPALRETATVMRENGR